MSTKCSKNQMPILSKCIDHKTAFYVLVVSLIFVCVGLVSNDRNLFGIGKILATILITIGIAIWLVFAMRDKLITIGTLLVYAAFIISLWFEFAYSSDITILLYVVGSIAIFVSFVMYSTNSKFLNSSN